MTIPVKKCKHRISTQPNFLHLLIRSMDISNIISQVYHKSDLIRKLE